MRRAFELALCRPPRPDEVEKAAPFWSAKASDSEGRRGGGKPVAEARHVAALAAFCLVLLNMNEFVYLGLMQRFHRG